MLNYNIPEWNSINNLSNEEYSIYLNKIEQLGIKYNHFKILNKVPHLKLDLPKFDYVTAKKQILNATKNKFVSINARNYYDTQKNGPLNHPYWSARALINYSHHSDRFFGNRDKEYATLSVPELQPKSKNLLDQNQEITLEDMIYYKTDIYNAVPYITNYINTYICDKSYRIYLWKLAAGGTIEWHNHSNLLWNKNLEINESILVHIPIITHSSVEMLVKINNKIYSEYYKPGNVYIFNNNYDHAVVNNSNVDRLHIVIMVPWSDNKLANLVSKERYE